MFRIRSDDTTGILFLDHKLLGQDQDQYRTRVVCVIPDEFTYFTHSFSVELILIWPIEMPDKPGEVKVLIRPQDVDEMKLIRTGIKSSELLKDGDEWFVEEPTRV